jgi:hypothetical protein
MTLLVRRTGAPGSGRVLARHQLCAQTVQLRDGSDRDIALGTVFRHHPNGALAVHGGEPPAGWRIWASSGDWPGRSNAGATGRGVALRPAA